MHWCQRGPGPAPTTRVVRNLVSGAQRAARRCVLSDLRVRNAWEFESSLARPQHLRPLTLGGHSPEHRRVVGQAVAMAGIIDTAARLSPSWEDALGARMIIVSNRVAVPDAARPPLAGGMAVAVKAALKNQNGMWFGWSGKVTEEAAGAPRTVEVNKATYVLIDLSRNDIQEYYNGLANSVLWPILHYRVDLQEFRTRTPAATARQPALRGQSERADERRRRRLGARLSSDVACARIAFARPSQ